MRDLGVKREDVIIATKVRGRMGPGPNAVGLSRGHIMDQIAACLKRLGLDHVDLYQIHGFDPVTPIEETLRALDDCVSRGLVTTIGCSNLAAWQIMKALGLSDKRGFARFETVQAYYSIAGRELEREIVPLVEDQGLGVMVWSPLAGGFLSGKFTRDKRGDNDSRRTTFDFPPVDKERAYDIIDAMAPIAKAHGASVARVALAWLLQRKGVMSVIIGAKSIEQLDDNLAAAELDAERRRDRDARRGQRAQARISGLDAGAAGRGPCAGGEGVGAFPQAAAGFDHGRDALRKVKWGVLGVAKIAVEKVIPAMQRARSRKSRRSRRAISARRGRPRTGLAFRALSGPTRICSPTARSRRSTIRCPMSCMSPWTIRALEAGKHVLCEKPIGLNAEEARSLIEARNRSGKIVAEAFMVRYHPQWRRARELARAGAIGEPRAIQTFFSYRLLDPENVRNRPPGGGGLYDIGCYAILTARYIFAAEPTRVVCDARPRSEFSRPTGWRARFSNSPADAI